MSNVLVKCPKCGKERYIAKDSMSKPTFTGLCWQCHWPHHLENLHKAKRDRPIDKRPITRRSDGYLEVGLPSSHWCSPMATKKGRSILVHRLAMAEYLGRLLERSEIVHHINGAKDDNRIENLELKTRQNHALSYQNGYAEGLKEGIGIRDKQLEKQIKLLQWQIKDLSKMLQLKLEYKLGRIDNT